MINQLINIGKYFETDKEGYLVSKVAYNSIQTDWRPAINDFLKYIKNSYKENVHSVYLRGSVATGTSIKGVSDIDFFVLTKKPILLKDKLKIWKSADLLNKKYTFITRFDVGFYTYDQILKKRERALIKLTSVCILGENLMNCIPDLRPGKDVSVTLPGLEKEIVSILNLETEDIDSEENKRRCVWIMKRLVRAGFELVSERANCFTRDLYKCYLSFSQYYPEKSREMKRVILLAINPSSELEKIKTTIKDIGDWIILEAKKQKLI